MEKIQHILDNLALLILTGGIIIFGAIAHSTTLALYAKKQGEKFTTQDWILNTIIAGFTGTMFCIGAAYMSNDFLFILFSGGMGAASGLYGLNKISESFLSFATYQIDKRKND